MNKMIIKYILFVVISAVLISIGSNSFSIPGQIYSSGLMGFSRLASDVLHDFFNIDISFTVFYISINLLLTFLVYKYIGKLFTYLSLLNVVLVTIICSFMKPLFEIDDILLLSVFGGIVNGFGIGLALKNNACTGGTDFLSIFLSSKYKKTMWNYIFGINCVLIILTGLIYGLERALYSIIFQFCSTQVINRMHKRYTSQTITIITAHPEEVSKEIFSTVRHGITKVNAVGEYKNTQTNMLYTVINGYQTDDVIKAILKADPKAFINVQDTKLVIGNYYQKPLD